MNAPHVFFTLGYILLAVGYLSQQDTGVSLFAQQTSERPDAADAWYQRNAKTLVPPSYGLPPSGWRREPVTPPDAYGRFRADDVSTYDSRFTWNAEHRYQHRRPSLVHCPWR
jgi:hypothetical protein